MKKTIIALLCVMSLILLSACSDSSENHEKALSDYKRQQLDKAKQVEDALLQGQQQRDQQIESATATETSEDDQPN